MWLLWAPRGTSAQMETGVALAMQTQTAGGATIRSAAVGHEYRQDDWPSVAVAPNGSVWVAWLSYVGDRDDIGLREYRDGQWSNLQWVPNTSGDSFMPQVAVDKSNRVWVVWSQGANGNWDIYARRFDPATQTWGALERWTTDPLPDINPRLHADASGRAALVWQGFRGKNSNIFLRTFDGERWSAEARVTNRAANDWEPAAAMDQSGNVWVVYDSYKNGNYDVFISRMREGRPEGSEMAVAESPRFEARPTVAVDGGGRVWVAWEAGAPNWGKDQGYVIRARQPGVPLGGLREARVRVYEQGEWHSPAVTPGFKGINVYQPHVFSDGKGSVWLAAKVRRNARPGVAAGGRPQQRGYWEYSISRWDGSNWSEPFALPNSWGRSSTRLDAALAPNGLWLAWPTDNRNAEFSHRPRREQVYAGQIAPPATPVSRMTWGTPPADKLEVKQGHADEAGDLKAIRTYVAPVGGSKLRIVRGDFHRHTELSWDGGGGGDGSLLDFYRYMIDAAGMDFGASTDHQGGAWPYWWWYTQKMTDMYYVPGAYTSIFGYERSATFPNGHRNVFFVKRADSRVTPFHMRSGLRMFALGQSPMGDEPGIGTGDLVENDTKLLYEEIRGRNAIAISHTSGTRMGTDWRDNDPQLEPVVEIFQGARTNYEDAGAPHSIQPPSDPQFLQRVGYQPEGWVKNAWAKGYKLGITSSSDHGSTHISYSLVYTGDLSRQGILDAIRKRHTYGAMDNIILDVRMGAHFMGDEFALKKPEPIRVKVRGTRSIAKVSVIRDSEAIYTVSPNRQDVQFEYLDKALDGNRHYYYVRVEQDDTMLAWSSPFFVNYR